jgi:sterol desaturase/sphingolipid hydroxylase (fatty acid hydroxylase superfamily)
MMWRVLSRVLYPGLLVGAVAATSAIAARTGGAVLLIGGATVATVGALLWLLELIRPYRREWRPPGRSLALDVLHTAVSSTVSPLVKAGLLFLLATTLHPHVGLGLWPTEWPVALQLLLAIPLADLGIYLAHRLMHTTDLGWRLHAIHHSPERLHFWASARSHPFNVVIKIVAESGPLLLLGIQPEVYGLFLVFMSVNGLLQHANVDLRPGPLSRILATNVVHRVHHARPLGLSNSNFGNTTMIWDQLFGTYQYPAEPVTEVGLEDYDIPERYLAHLATPFVLRHFERGE